MTAISTREIHSNVVLVSALFAIGSFVAVCDQKIGHKFEKSHYKFYIIASIIIRSWFDS